MSSLLLKHSKNLKIIVLVGALITYAIPFMSVKLVGLGVMKYSFSDIVKFIPAPNFSKSESQGPEIDFGKMLKKVSELRGKPKSSDSKFDFKAIRKAMPLILGALIPVMLGISYVLVIISIIFLVTGGLAVVGRTLFLSCLTSLYVILGSVYLGSYVQKALADSGGGLLGAITKTVSKGVGVQTEEGAYILFACVLVVFVFHKFQKS